MDNKDVNNQVYIERQPRFIETVKILKKIITDQSRVVEIGANDASFREFNYFKEWITIDKFGEPDIRIDINGPDVKIPLDNSSVDIIICTEVLEHLTVGSPLIKEMSRILNNNGRAIISVPNIVSLQSRLKVLFGRLPDLAASGDCGPPLDGTGLLIDGHWVGGHVVDFNTKRLILYLKRGGLKLVKHWRTSTSIGIGAFWKIKKIKSFLIPKTLSDFILFELKKA